MTERSDEELAGGELRKAVRQMLGAAWRQPGFCVPNPSTYPHQWLWDSCFHSLIWSALGDARAVVELTNTLVHQDPVTGFVPHITYWDDPSQAESFWGCRATSCITQPPMFGHAAAQLHAAGTPLDPSTIEAARRGIEHLLVDRPRTDAGLIPVYHPWETGCDDSPRWDGFRAPETSWWRVKGDIVAALRAAGGTRTGRGPGGAGRFVVGSIGFNALVAWNARQLLTVDAAGRGRSGLADAADELAGRIAARWDDELATWIDDGPPSGRIRTLDSLLALLVDPRAEGFDQLVDPAAFGAPFGPRGVHRAEPTYQPDRYWRGPAWPQLGYLLWWAARQAGHGSLAVDLAGRLRRGARASGLAEYWNPETGAGLGASPQSWTGLAIVVGRDDR